MKQFRDLVSVEEARGALEGFSVEPGVETADIGEGAGRVLAEDARAETPVPPFPRSLMDGYAVRAEDTYDAEELDPSDLSFVGAVEAGDDPSLTVGPGETARISTGAVLPEGADAVVMVERTDREDGRVKVRRSVAPGENVLESGGDVTEGDVVVSGGTVLGPRELGGLAAVGVDEAPLKRRPSAAVFSTGGELVGPGSEPRRGQVFEANSYVLCAALRGAGFEPEFLGTVPDDEAEVARTIREAAEHDLVLSSGSTSAGSSDVLYRVVEREGELLIHGVELKPGKPTAIARVDGTPFVGLPGHPASAYAVFKKVVEPFARRASGLPLHEKTVAAEMGSIAKSENGRHELRFVRLVDRDGGFLAYPVEKVSGAISLLLEADGYVEVPKGVSRLDEGEGVDVVPLGPEVSYPRG